MRNYLIFGGKEIMQSFSSVTEQYFSNRDAPVKTIQTRFKELNMSIPGKLTVSKLTKIYSVIIEERRQAMYMLHKTEEQASKKVGTGIDGLEVQMRYETLAKEAKTYSENNIEELNLGIAAALKIKLNKLRNKAYLRQISIQDARFLNIAEQLIGVIIGSGSNSIVNILHSNEGEIGRIELVSNDIINPKKHIL